MRKGPFNLIPKGEQETKGISQPRTLDANKYSECPSKLKVSATKALGACPVCMHSKLQQFQTAPCSKMRQVTLKICQCNPSTSQAP